MANIIPTAAPPKHLDLDYKTKEIRILILLPSYFHDPISCTLSRANLEEQPQYDALSYVWGDPRICRTIYVDDSVKNVTVNLFAALRRLRAKSHTRPRRLWIDALCIDQENNQEKSHQVSIIGSIYRTISADISLAWRLYR
ncbi:heterokaryon incompatibility protein-domain-containing protein [Podospora fimiseda]|uniref:Heterokaryon incompatibility protein-domain-containing protein n=1 Tax=Podospora fimiseda TaxID=252190 RepID=A0AAN6YLL6_9PEZI|nr:heterokaryon incompatibility protein-domain-containing protein [Podospora fimiseda]